ncbi:MAG: hypothetical protein V4591_04725 [Bdellovibrionota bacterium]
MIDNELTTKKFVCPVCDSSNIESSYSMSDYTAPMGVPVPMKLITNTCRDCGEAGDFEALNDRAIEEAQKKSRFSAVLNLLSDLESKNIKMAYIERTLGLPQRTIARWKGGEYSASGFALLQIIHSFPWILEVAKSNFDPVVGLQHLLTESTKIFSQYLPNFVKSQGINSPHFVSSISLVTVTSGFVASAPPLDHNDLSQTFALTGSGY